jgi:hypothetical protein
MKSSIGRPRPCFHLLWDCRLAAQSARSYHVLSLQISAVSPDAIDMTVISTVRSSIFATRPARRRGAATRSLSLYSGCVRRYERYDAMQTRGCISLDLDAFVEPAASGADTTVRVSDEQSHGRSLAGSHRYGGLGAVAQTSGGRQTTDADDFMVASLDEPMASSSATVSRRTSTASP